MTHRYYYNSSKSRRKLAPRQTFLPLSVQNSTPKFDDISLGFSASAERVLDGPEPLFDFRSCPECEGRGYLLIDIPGGVLSHICTTCHGFGLIHRQAVH